MKRRDFADRHGSVAGAISTLPVSKIASRLLIILTGALLLSPGFSSFVNGAGELPIAQRPADCTLELEVCVTGLNMWIPGTIKSCFMKFPSWKVCCSGLCFWAGIAVAQLFYPPITQVSPGVADSNPASGGQTQQQQAQAGQTRHFFRANDLAGVKVKDPSGQDLGKIDELVVDSRTGQTLAAISVSRGRQALVPVQALQVSERGGMMGGLNIVLHKTKAELAAGPTVPQHQWSNLENPAFTKNLYSHYNVEAPASSVGGAGEESLGGRDSGTATNQARPSPLPLPRQK
ncbi:MAG TPA: PRC-barrel domain-containing protein [Clostridia bacterium]|nr:PRC-barrel domain-containing protein [Clostridia bacterium]